MILRLSEMTVVSEGSGTKAKISVMKTFPLTNSSVGAKNASRGSTVQPVSRPKPPRLLPGISRMSSTPSRLSIPIPTSPQLDVTKFKTWVEDAIRNQQQDIDRLSGSVSRIERDMALFKDFMEEVQTELASHRQIQYQENGEGLASVREELNELRQQLNSNYARPGSRSDLEMSRKSIDIIAHDVLLVGQKVDEIDKLKKELAQLNTRLRSLESPPSTDAAGTAHITEEMPTGVRETRSRRKRNHSQIDTVEATSQLTQAVSPELPTKRRRTRNIPTSTEVSTAEVDSAAGWNRLESARKQKANGSLSSDAISDQDDEQSQFDYPEDETDHDYQPPEPATPVSTFMRSGDKGTTDIASPADLAALPMSERIFSLKTVVEPHTWMRNIDMMLGRKRASNGLLLTKDGKVDRRCLRGLSVSGDEENQPFSRSSLAPEETQNGAQHIVNQQLQDPFERCLTPQPKSSSLNFSITPRDPKPYKCGSCGKAYVARSGLQHVSFVFPLVMRNLADESTAHEYCKR